MLSACSTYSSVVSMWRNRIAYLARWDLLHGTSYPDGGHGTASFACLTCQSPDHQARPCRRRIGP